DGRLAVVLVGLGPLAHGLGLGVAAGGDGGRLGHALDLDRLGQGGAALALGRALEPRLLGLGLGDGDLAGLLGRGLLLDRVAAGVGRLADRGVELALGQLGPAGGHQLLGGEDLLVLGRLRQRAGGGRLGGGGVGLGLDLGVLEGEVAAGDRDLLLGPDAGLLGLAAGVGLGDGRLHLGPGGLGPAEVGEVVALGLDVLQLEGVEHEALAGQAVLGLLGHGGG